MDPDPSLGFLNAVPIVFVLGWLFWLAVMVFVAVVAWRWMRAHEKIASSLRSIADSWQSSEPGPGRT